MLTLNSTNKVTFKVNVHGTASTPTVRCVLGDAPGLTFQAVKLQEDKYEVLMDLPKTLTPGSYPFKIEVLLNGRLLTPISTQISVQENAEQDTSTESRPSPTLTQESIPASKVPELKPVKNHKTISKPQTEPTDRGAKLKLRLVDIANEAKTQTPPVTVKATPQVVLEQTKSIPVTLTKGDIIYK